MHDEYIEDERLTKTEDREEKRERKGERGLEGNSWPDTTTRIAVQIRSLEIRN